MKAQSGIKSLRELVGVAVEGLKFTREAGRRKDSKEKSQSRSMDASNGQCVKEGPEKQNDGKWVKCRRKRWETKEQEEGRRMMK